MPKLKIDVRNTKRFFYEFPDLDFNGQPFIEAEVCPSCYSKLLDLEEEEIITLL